HVVSRPLDRVSQLDMAGNPNSGGIWAPCLSWHDGLFYLIYTDSKKWTGSFKDVYNYLVTAPDITGPWSEPIFLDGVGFDSSLYHDDDGKKWYVQMVWDHRPGKNQFGGIMLQEYSHAQKKLVGERINIFTGTPTGLVEGPHLYKKDGWYYLLTAEGGTFTTHQITIARSKKLTGPYEVMPGNPLITSAYDPSLELKSAGHGSLVELKDGSWYLAHLCRRPLQNGRSILGRETALQPVVWKDGWPRLASGKNTPDVVVAAPDLTEQKWPEVPGRTDFDESKLGIEWQTLRIPLSSEIMNTTERPGFLRLRGQESIASNFRQSIVARRQTAFKVRATTCVEFEPHNFQQMAGLAAFYSTDCFYYLFITRADHAEKCLGLMACERGNVWYPIEKEFPLTGWKRVYLKCELDGMHLNFFYSPDGKAWTRAGSEVDASILSDEHVPPCGFTGNMLALACQDMTGSKHHADFDFFDYEIL
ncbi:MAG TPA: glycoside hydrolase family 43 protein, partial [Spirochaetota bacterium]|nr:glycoside hydrolase family 43 protein [Spirochaetota bacterium]